MQFTDTVTIAGTRRRDDGYLVADARIARTGVQTYLGSEMGMPDKATVRVYRSGAEVFSKDTLTSAAHRPVTNDHPPEMVNSENWKQYSVGQTSDEIKGEGIFIRVPLMISDEDAIREIEGGKRELSAGYLCDVEFVDGKTPDGEEYDAIQKNIRLNHVAIVQRGRAGSQVRIGDSAKEWGAAPITTDADKEKTMTLRTIMVDGLSIEVTDQGAQAISKLQKAVSDAETKLTDTDKAHTSAIEAKDAEIVKKDEEIGTLKADLKTAKDSAPKAEDLDKLVQDRAALVSTVKALDSKIDVSGKTDAELKTAAVAAKLGDEMVKDASEAEIAGMFRAISKDVKAADPFASVVNDGIQKTGDDNKAATDAYAAMVKDMSSAHQPAN